MLRKAFGTASGTVAYWTDASAGPDAPWLAFLPGFTADHTLFHAQTAHFAGKANCFVWDAPAHGESWGDVDFDERTVNVHASCDEHGELKDPKTEAGFRILPMPDQMAESLLKRKAAQVEEYHKYVPELVVEVNAEDGEIPAGAVEVEGKVYDMTPDAPVIADEHGRRTQPHALSVWWPRHRGEYGLEGWTLHELRHSFLSLAAARGIHPSIMQQLAGHKSAATTMDIYTHVNMAGKRAAMDAMQAAFM